MKTSLVILYVFCIIAKPVYSDDEDREVEGKSVQAALEKYVHAVGVNEGRKWEALEELKKPGRLPDIADFIANDKLALADVAISLCEEANFTPARKSLMTGLDRTVGVMWGGGTEFQRIQENYTRHAWRAYIALTRRSDLDPAVVPSREVVVELKRQEELRPKEPEDPDAVARHERETAKAASARTEEIVQWAESSDIDRIEKAIQPAADSNVKRDAATPEKVLMLLRDINPAKLRFGRILSDPHRSLILVTLVEPVRLELTWFRDAASGNELRLQSIGP